eukprot:5794033-Karenia_brevis.AAC.1
MAVHIASLCKLTGSQGICSRKRTRVETRLGHLISTEVQRVVSKLVGLRCCSSCMLRAALHLPEWRTPVHNLAV